MRSTILLAAVLLALPGAASAGQSTTSLKVGVTVVAACPPGSGKPCGQSNAMPATSDMGSAATTRSLPIAILRDDAARTLTVVY